MHVARLLVCLVVIGATAASAHAAGYCGFAYNFGNGAQARVRLKGYRVDETGVTAKLVCSKWRTICNGRKGTIHALEGVMPGTKAPILQGSLRYGDKLSCGVYCQVDGTASDPHMLFCQFNCPPDDADTKAVQVSFTVGPTVCQ